MAFGTREDQTEPATPKRREEARERGQVAKSRDLSSAMTLLAVILALWALGPSVWEGLALEMQASLQGLVRPELGIADIQAMLVSAFARPLLYIAPLLGAACLGGLLANLLQVGVLLTATPLLPRWSRLNPWEGITRLLSPQSSVELAKGIIKLAILGAIAFFSFRADLDKLFLVGEQGVAPFFARVALMTATVMGRSSLALLVLGGFDYLVQRWEYERGIRMSKAEIKEETRQREGDPKIRARIRSMQRELGKRRMMAAVPTATVMITNPRHLAVALRYDRGSTPAPQVVAKGAGYVAERMKALARTAGVPIVEDRPLARLLYQSVDVGQLIPATLYKAVAQILAYVYSLQGGRR